MKQINFKEMYNAGVHLGSSIKTINPKMKPYIMCTHEGIAIIDILKTYTRLFWVTLFLKKVIATEGYQVLFVGTQKAIAPLIEDIAIKSSSPYINKRWKGGFLTNFKTMKGQTKFEEKGFNKWNTFHTNSNQIWLESSLSPPIKLKPVSASTIKQQESSKINQQHKWEQNLEAQNKSWKDSFASDDLTLQAERSSLSKANHSLAQKNPNSSQVSSSLSSLIEEGDRKFDTGSWVFSLTNAEEITRLTHVTELTTLPDIVIIVGQQKELKAVKECQKLNIPIITILDSDGDPEKTSLFIPANDDSWTSVEFILKHLGHSILVGRLLYDQMQSHYFISKQQNNVPSQRTLKN